MIAWAYKFPCFCGLAPCMAVGRVSDYTPRRNNIFWTLVIFR
jgi:hypothetical protein